MAMCKSIETENNSKMTNPVKLSRTTNQGSETRGFWRQMESEILRRTIYPVIRRRMYPGSFVILEEFREYEFASLAAVEACQLKKLRSILAHAGRTVPYYEEIFSSMQFNPEKACLPRELSRLPILTKSILRERSKELVAKNSDPRSLMLNASGGSTGRPVEFYQDRHYWETAHASRSMFMSWWGIAQGEPTASIWGADRDIPDWNWRERLHHKLCQIRICNSFSLSETRMEQFCRDLNKWQPRFVNGYATALEVFSRFLLEHPNFRIRPRAVESSAETLTDAQREVIEKAFAAPVYNFYGSREVNNLAAECSAHRGLHTNMLSRYIEVVDDEGQPLPAGLPGRILVTDLSNSVMPLIRYENEDIGSWSDVACSCGRPFRLLEKVWGRSSDMITTPSGKLIHGEYFTHLFYHVPEVSVFQIVQESIDCVRVSIVLRQGVEYFSSEKIRQKIDEALGQGVECQVSIVEAIPRSASGKHRFTISRVKPSWRAFQEDRSGGTV
jgi:phenylacetate-CoA ligase